eukprot:7743322-Lingulodinium_polyedra.AAC.1
MAMPRRFFGELGPGPHHRPTLHACPGARGADGPADPLSALRTQKHRAQPGGLACGKNNACA